MAEVPKKMVVTSELEKSLIFQNLMKAKLPLRVCIHDIEYPGVIDRIESGGILIRLQTPTIGSVVGDVRTNFVFHSNYHYFSAPARQVDENLIHLQLPDQINKNMMRKYERVNALGKVFVRFRIVIRAKKHEFKGVSLLASERAILQELKKPRPAVDKILGNIKTLTAEFAQKFNLRIFKPQETLSFEETVVKESKRILLIQDTFEDSLQERRFGDGAVMTVGDAFEWLVARGEPRSAVESRIVDLLDRKRKERIFSECLIPLMVEGEAAGCLRLANDLDFNRSIKPNMALKAAEYASILIEALARYDYFNLKSGERAANPVLNLSAGGLLFRLEERRLKGYIVHGSVLLMVLSFPDRQVRVRGVVYRIDEEGAAFGVKFQEIAEEDVHYIEAQVKSREPFCA